METLHPLAVHVPITLILVWPAVDLAALWFDRRDVAITAGALLVLAIPAALFATVTGQSAYDAAIAAGHAPALLDRHADLAALVPWFLIVVAAVRGPLARRYGRPARLVAILLGFLLGGVIVSVGHEGGELVFDHGVGVQPGGAPR
ncbi:MAG: hypothetical protein IT384_02080 [Deltaproteobacteria bacterium]|nr:hypothetical protein [Deltaproteobacteria bacterium]